MGGTKKNFRGSHVDTPQKRWLENIKSDTNLLTADCRENDTRQRKMEVECLVKKEPIYKVFRIKLISTNFVTQKSVFFNPPPLYQFVAIETPLCCVTNEYANSNNRNEYCRVLTAIELL